METFKSQNSPKEQNNKIVFNYSQNEREYNELHQRQSNLELIQSFSIEKENTENSQNSQNIIIIPQQKRENSNYHIENFSQYNKKGEDKSICKDLNSTNKNKSNYYAFNGISIEDLSHSQNNTINDLKNNDNTNYYISNFSQYNIPGGNKSIYQDMNVDNKNKQNSNANDELLSFPFSTVEDQYSEIPYNESNIDFSTKTLVEFEYIFMENNFDNIIKFFEKFFGFISESLTINNIYQKSINCLIDEQIDFLKKFIIDFEKKIGAEFTEENENIKEKSENEDHSKHYQNTVFNILEKEYKIEIDKLLKHKIKKLIYIIYFFKSNTKEVIRNKFFNKILINKDVFLLIKNLKDGKAKTDVESEREKNKKEKNSIIGTIKEEVKEYLEKNNQDGENIIFIILDINGKDIKEEKKIFYFLNDYENENFYKNNNDLISHDIYKLDDLNQSNIDLFINKEKREFSKFFKPEKKGYYYIKLVFKKNLIIVDVCFYIAKI